MIVSIVLPPSAIPKAIAATTQITALSTPIIYDQTAQVLGRIKVAVPAGAVKKNDVMIVKLPFALHDGISTKIINEDDATPPQGTNYILVPKTNNGLQKENLTVTPLGDKEFKITATEDSSFANDLTFYILLNNVDIDKGYEGPVKINFEGPAATGFPAGEVIPAFVVTKGTVQLSAEGIDSSNSDFSFQLRIKELILKSLQNGDNSIKLKLPTGFKWDRPTDDSETVYYGDSIDFSYTVNENELEIHVNSSQTTKASMWDIPLSFTAHDDDRIADGDIYAYVSGLTRTDVDKIKVGIYKDYGVSIIIDNELPTIMSGKTGQKISTIKIKEQVPKSIIAGRSLTLTLPDGVKWVADDTDQDGINLGVPRVQSDGRTLNYTISGTSTDEASLELDQLKVAVRPGFTGNLGVTIEGAGIEKQILSVANVVKPVSITSTIVPDVVIGKSNQAMADLLITETVKEALKKDGAIQISLPSGVQFVEKPDVQVTEGNLYLKQISLINDHTLQVVIDAESTKPSTISITNAKLRIDRTVPEGSIEAGITGAALIETTGTTTLNGASYDLWKYDHTFDKIGIANVITPAPGKPIPDQVEFKIDKKVYYVNGQGKSMDVAPFIEKSRTFLPVRYVAIALGVDTDDIFWDDEMNKVTILKGDRVVQLTIGSKIMLINGMAIPMDVPAHIKNGRTQLPLRFVAEAFGAKVDFKESTRTVTIQ